MRPAAEVTTTLTGKNFAPLGGERLRCVFGEPGAAAGGGDTADASPGNSPAGGGGIFSGWFGRRLRERMAMEGGDNQRMSRQGGRRQLPAEEEGGALEVLGAANPNPTPNPSPNPSPNPKPNPNP